MKTLSLRLDDELYDRVKIAADRDRRSINGQIEWLLNAALSLQIETHVLAAQHTYTAACDGLHPPGPCPDAQP